MDPSTVVLILALNLMAIGGLLAMIGRSTVDAQGMRAFAIGSMVFGLAYLVRLALGHSSTSMAGVLPDMAMIAATLCYATGLRQFGGQPPIRTTRIVAGSLGFGLLSFLGTLLWHDVGRHAVLNGGLAFNHLWLAVLASLGAYRVGGTLRVPLTVLAVSIGLLGLLTAVRAVAAVALGVEVLFVGLPAKIFYGYSTVTSVLLGPNLLWMVFVRLNGRLAQLATHDPLTGLLNRNGLDEALTRHFGNRSPQDLVLCQLDIDHFKRINDQHGHATGDAVLKGVGQVLMSQVRGGDFVARLGGEEFLVACCGISQAQAQVQAERLRTLLSKQQHSNAQGEPLHCTVSIGVSQAINTRAQWEDALRQADAALYRAKAQGRDQVVGF